MIACEFNKKFLISALFKMIRDECKERPECENCPYITTDDECLFVGPPEQWNIEGFKED